MRKHCIFIIALFLVVFTGSYCFATCSRKEQCAKGRHHKTTGEISENPKLSGKIENGIRVVEVKASRYKFEPDQIVVKLGEKVRLVVTATDAAHGLAISEFKVNISVPAGETRSVTFIADKQGKFNAHCIVYCGPGHSDMQASFVVK